MFEFKFADIGEGIHEGKLLEWFVKEGDIIENGDSVFLVETDKVNAEIPAPVAGKIVKLNGNIGDTIHVGDVIVVIDDGNTDTNSHDSSKEKNEDLVEAQAEEKGAGVVGEITVSNDIIPSFHQSKTKETIKKRKVLATPVARAMAKKLNININEMKGTGVNKRVMKADIQDFYDKSHDNSTVLENTKTIENTPLLKIDGNIEEVSLSGTRKAISKAMTIAKQNIPHAVLMDEFDVTDLVIFRGKAKITAAEKNIKLTYLPFVIKAVTIALKEFPKFNSSYDKQNEKLLMKKFYNIGIATDTDKGLLVPVIKDVDHLGILEIASSMNNLIESANNHSLSLDDLKNGTFSITNYGSVGSTFGTPIINFPEVAILGIGRIDKKPTFNDANEVVPRYFMPISLGFDHRIIDGADAGKFSNRIKELLSNPQLLLMS